MFTIRRAQIEDAEAIARVQVASWQSTYVGIMPDELLRTLSVEQRAAWWHRVLTTPPPASCAFVAMDADQIVGFASGGHEMDNMESKTGQVYTIYLLNTHQRQGIGRALMRSTVDHLYKQGFESLIIWVASANPSRKFYEALGGTEHSTKSEVFGGSEIAEVSYYWPDLAALNEQLRG